MNRVMLREVGAAAMSRRIACGYDVARASRESGIPEDAIEDFESGELRLTGEQLTRLAEAYGVGVEAFFGGRTTPMQYLLA